jgi:four helix bundle protein
MSKLEFASQMQVRTKQFAVQVIKFFSKMPKTEEGKVLGRQLLRSGTSVAANYRAACRAKSGADFIHKLGTVVEETDESLFWLELLSDAGVCTSGQIGPLKSEADELLRVFQTSLNTAKRNAGR